MNWRCCKIVLASHNISNFSQGEALPDVKIFNLIFVEVPILRHDADFEWSTPAVSRKLAPFQT